MNLFRIEQIPCQIGMMAPFSLSRVKGDVKPNVRIILSLGETNSAHLSEGCTGKGHDVHAGPQFSAGSDR